MASFMVNEAARAIAAGDIDLLSDTIKMRLVMTDTTVDSQNDGIVDLADYTTLDPGDAAGATSETLGTKAITKEDANNRAIFTSATVVFSGLGGDATRNYQGALLYVHVDGTDANDLAIAYIEFSAPIVKEATQVSVPCPAAGWLNLSVANAPD